MPIGYFTPDELPAARFVRRLALPDDLQFVANVSGALLELCYPYAWQQYGDKTPEECADEMLRVLIQYWNDNMIGEIVEYITVDPPPYVLPANGATYQRVDYPRLYDRLHPNYHVNPDEFFLPDLSARVLIAAGDLGADVFPFGEYGGELRHILTVDELAEHSHTSPPHSHTSPPHSHTSPPHSHTEGIALPALAQLPVVPIPSAVPAPGAAGLTSVGISSDSADIDDTEVAIETTGASEPHNNMQPYFVVFRGVRYA